MKIAVVTGASSGLGKEFVLQIAKKYRTIKEIWVIARSKDALDDLQLQVPNIKIRVISLDLTKEKSIEEYIDILKKENPEIRLLVNAAGYGIIGKFKRLTYSDNIGMIDLNCRALVAITYASIPYMKFKSNILNIASAAAFLPQPNFAIYAATKSFVLSFSLGLRQELLSKGIIVTAVCPGPVNTEFFDKAEIYTEVKLYKKLVRAKCPKVVNKALIDAYKGKSMSVYGLPMNGLKIACKILPHSFLVKFI